MEELTEAGKQAQAELYASLSPEQKYQEFLLRLGVFLGTVYERHNLNRNMLVGCMYCALYQVTPDTIPEDFCKWAQRFFDVCIIKE